MSRTSRRCAEISNDASFDGKRKSAGRRPINPQVFAWLSVSTRARSDEEGGGKSRGKVDGPLLQTLLFLATALPLYPFALCCVTCTRRLLDYPAKDSPRAPCVCSSACSRRLSACSYSLSVRVCWLINLEQYMPLQFLACANVTRT